MVKGLSATSSLPAENAPVDPVASREERRATGRMVAVVVGLFLILLAMYHAWIRKTAVLAGIMVPALIMLLYAAWVLFLAKRDKEKRLIAESNLRAESILLSEVISTSPSATTSKNNAKSNKPSKLDKDPRKSAATTTGGASTSATSGNNNTNNIDLRRKQKKLTKSEAKRISKRKEFFQIKQSIIPLDITDEQIECIDKRDSSATAHLSRSLSTYN